MSPSPTAEPHTGAIQQPEPVKLQTLQTAQPSASQPMSKFTILNPFGALPVFPRIPSPGSFPNRILQHPESFTIARACRGLGSVPCRSIVRTGIAD
jgi:hypothetical protein